MGSLCSCLCIEDLEGFVYSDASSYRHCVCLGGLAQQFIQMYTALIQQREVRAIPLSTQETSSDHSTPTADNSISETYCSPPRPLPFDDPRCSRPQDDGLIFRRDKSSSHIHADHEESEPLRINGDPDKELMSMSGKLYGSNYEGASKLFYSMSMAKNSTKVTSGMPYTFASSEDEDVCPTCLEEYTSENPRIVMKCSHHFHLGCIYEWQERSELCPVCGKVMVFNETE